MIKVLLAYRYLLKQRVSCVAVFVIALSVFVVTVVMTVMTGLVSDFKQKNHALVGDCVIGTDSLVGFSYYEEVLAVLEAHDMVAAVSPVVHGVALVSQPGSEQGWGMQVVGIDPNRHSRVTGFARNLCFHGRDVDRAFAPEEGPQGPGCIIGIDRILSRNEQGQYNMHYAPLGRGFEVTCFPLTARGAPLKGGAGEFNTKVFYLSDIARTGLAREDNYLFYVPLDLAQQLGGMAGADKRISAFYIRFHPGVTPEEGLHAMTTLWQGCKRDMAGRPQADLLNHCFVQDWRRFRREYIAPMEKEELAMVLLFVLVAVTVIFIVFVVFYMLMTHKGKDIGILKSVGASDRDVMDLFTGFAALVGTAGAGIGLLAGGLFLRYINDLENWLYEHYGFQLWDRTIFSIGDIPHRLAPGVLAVIALAAIAVCLLGAWIPTWKAARMRPIETLRVGQA